MSKASVYNKLEELGYNKNAIAGIMANIDVETGGTFDPMQQQQLSGGGIGRGRGLFQIEVGNPLYNAYADFLKNNEKENTADSQVEFMHETVYGKYQGVIGEGHAKQLRKVFEEGDAEQTTKEFMKRWERPSKPHTERRVASAKQFLTFKPDDIQEAIDETKAQTIVVKSGDNLIKIARKLNIPLEELARVNNITNINDIKIGQKLRTPNLQDMTERNNL